MKKIKINELKFKVLLLKKKITQTELSKISEVSRTTITSIAAGKTCKLETGQKIADALKINLEDILQEV